jgi:hypothetical protein
MDRVEAVMEKLKNAMLPLKVSPGELFDRYTILRIKSVKVADAEKCQQASDEADTIAWYVYDQVTPFETPISVHITSLYNVNMRLWEIEDEIRELDSWVFDAIDPSEGRPVRACDIDFMKLARSVYTTNDERSMLKAKLNEACGHSTEVKQYAGYSP